MTIVRRACAEDMAAVAAFYHEHGYTPALETSDQFVVAEQSGVLCGVGRICQEEGVLVLRGMRVRREMQRRGIGGRLLQALESLVADRPCFCIAHAHLRTFYGRSGFVEIDASEAPPFLRERCAGYRRDHQANAILMRRPAGGRS